MNSILIIDIYLILKSPFYPRHKRRFFYYIYIGIVTFSLLVFDLTINYSGDVNDRSLYSIVTDDLAVDTNVIDYYVRLSLLFFDIFLMCNIILRLG
jgi:hypothetical protein